MSATGATGTPRLRQKPGMRGRRVEVVCLDWHSREDRFNERLPPPPAPRIRDLHSYEQLRCRDRRDRDVILIRDHSVEGRAAAFGGDQNGRVEDQAFQRRSSMRRPARSSASSLSQAGSRAMRADDLLHGPARPDGSRTYLRNRPAIAMDHEHLASLLDRVQHRGEATCCFRRGNPLHSEIRFRLRRSGAGVISSRRCPEAPPSLRH